MKAPFVCQHIMYRWRDVFTPGHATSLRHASCDTCGHTWIEVPL